jgi:hypothetical protein
LKNLLFPKEPLKLNFLQMFVRHHC